MSSYILMDELKQSYPLYTANQTRLIDQLAIEQMPITGFDLMQRAASALFDCVSDQYESAKQILVVCGKGNNAGDGYLLANLLAQTGKKVTVVSLVDPKGLQLDAKLAYETALEGLPKGAIEVIKHNEDEAQNSIDHLSELKALVDQADLIVDAILGTGLTGSVSGYFLQVIELINHADKKVLAVDIPSGLNADTGYLTTSAIQADKTVTFIALKQGLFTGKASEFVGNVYLADLQVPSDLLSQVPSTTTLYGPHSAVLLPRPPYAHKGMYGPVALIGGHRSMMGAILLSATTCLKTGAGVTKVFTHESHAALISCAQPELISIPIEDRPDVAFLEHELTSAKVIAIGPGLGQDDWGKALVQVVLKVAAEHQIATVWDADALNLLAVMKLDLSGLNSPIITPHPKEASRLLNLDLESILSDRLGAVADLARQYHSVALLKGAGTCISNGDDSCIIDCANPSMATGGMGDVLTGLMAALLAQGVNPLDACAFAAWLQGQAAGLAVKEQGSIGLTASQMPNYLRKIINTSQ